MNKHVRSILATELQRLSGILFARYMVEYMKMNADKLSEEQKKTLQTVESMQFFDQLLSGKFSEETTKIIDVETSEEYKQMVEVAQAINKLT